MTYKGSSYKFIYIFSVGFIIVMCINAYKYIFAFYYILKAILAPLCTHLVETNIVLKGASTSHLKYSVNMNLSLVRLIVRHSPLTLNRYKFQENSNNRVIFQVKVKIGGEGSIPPKKKNVCMFYKIIHLWYEWDHKFI